MNIDLSDIGTFTLSVDNYAKGTCIQVYDIEGGEVHRKDTTGYESWTYNTPTGINMRSIDSNGIKCWWEYDGNGNRIHTKNSDGYEEWIDYDSYGYQIHFKYSSGEECWLDRMGYDITKEEYNKTYNINTEK